MFISPAGTVGASSFRVAVLSVAGLLLASCASGEATPAGNNNITSEGTTSASPPPSSSSSSPRPNIVRIVVSVENEEVTPAPRRVKVKLGRTVRLTVTSDVRDEIHVHGFDKSRAVRAGQPATVQFIADQQGVFEVELEQAGVQLVQLQVQ